MKRYLIEDAKCGITAGGIACGPVPGNVVVSIKYNDGNNSMWLSNVEVEGIPNIILSDIDIFEDLIKEDFDDEEFTQYVHEHNIDEFNGIELGEYEDIFESINNEPDNETIPLIRYLIALTRCEMEDVDGLIAAVIGRYSDELDIPISDIEEEYYEDIDEDFDEEDD